jgi:lipopolysaccharide export system protein LptA
MKDRDGNVIESRKGTYDGKEGLFMFEDQVELYMDSIEIKTNQLRYFNETERAHFGRNTYLWRDNGFLRADAGWYDRPTRLVYFTDHVFMFDPSYDAWADELYYHQQDGAVDLLRNAQVLDSTNKSVYLGDHMQYLPANDSLSQRGLLTGNPAIIYYGENEDHVVDTLFARADSFYVYTVPRYAIPEKEVKDAEKRLDDMLFDALSKKRAEEGEQREKERIEKMRAVGKLPPEWVEQQQRAERDSLARLDSLAKLPAMDSLSIVDSVAVQPIVDSVAVQPIVDSVGVQSVVDSVGVPSLDSLTVMPGLTRHLDSTAVAVQDTVAVRDTTPIRYVHAWNNVKMYRSDIQAACDSMVFCELDSIARLFGRPILWNEVRNQLTAEDMQLLFRNGNFDRGSMITDAWIISQQDSVHFNQIKSTEMLGWFRDNKIYRFDALGGVTAIFYMVDEDVVTTINLKEAKSMTAALKDGTAQRLLYMETIKSDAYPVGDLEMSKQRLKGFEWRADERPVRREAITVRQIRTTERSKYVDLQKPLYRQTNKFFDGYMYELFEQINARKRAELERRERERDSLARAAALDSLAALEIPGQARNDGVLRHDDEELVQPVVDTMGVMPDSTVILSEAKNLVDSTVVEVSKPVVENNQQPVIDREKPAEAVDVASPETVVRSEQLTRAEKRALRKAERKARKEARRAARLARRQARAAARAAAREARSRK